MNELQKLYDVLSRDGYYTKSFDEFKVKWNDGAYRKKVYDVVSRERLYTKTEDEFYKKYSSETVKQPTKVQPKVEEQEPVKKKEPTVSASKLAQPTSVSSSNEDKPIQPPKPKVEKSIKPTSESEWGKMYTWEGNQSYRNKNGNWYKYTYTDQSGESHYETKVTDINRVKKLEQHFKTGEFVKGYPGKEEKDYLYKNGVWKEADSKNAKYTTITDAGRVAELNRHFGKQASTSTGDKIFVGYPGKEANEYKVGDNGVWMKRAQGKGTWEVVTNEGSIGALNRKFEKEIDPKKADLQQIAAKNSELNSLNHKIDSYVTSSLVDDREGAVVGVLSKQFPQFKFEEAQAGADRMTVSLKGSNRPEDKITIMLDNWRDSEDAFNAKRLRDFMKERITMADSRTNLEEKEGYFVNKETERRQAAIRGGMGERDFVQPELKINKDGSVSYATEPETKPGETAMKDFEAKRQLMEARQANIADRSSYMKGLKNSYERGDIDRKQFGSAVAAIKVDDEEMKRHDNFVNDVNLRRKELVQSEKLQEDYIADVESKLKSGEITQEQYDTEYKDKIAGINQRVEEKRTELKVDDKSLNTSLNAMNRALGENRLIQEQIGSTGGVMVSNLLKGATNLGRFAGMTPEDQDKFIRELTGIMTTEEWMSSKDRTFLQQAAMSTTSSLGAIATKFIPVVGQAASMASLFSLGFFEQKDDLDNATYKNPETGEIEKVNIPPAQKLLMSAAYGIVSMYLEKMGLDELLTGAVGKKLAMNVVKDVAKKITKDSPKEFIENALISETKSRLQAAGVRVGMGMLTEGATEALQSLASVSTKEIYDGLAEKEYFNNKSGWEIASDIVYEGALGGAGGGMVTGAITGAQLTAEQRRESKYKNEINAMIAAAETEGASQAIITTLKAKVIKGELTAPEAKQIARDFTIVKSKVDQMPNDLSEQGKAASLDLMMEKDKLERTIQGKDPNLVKPQKDRIAEIDKRLQEIAKENAVQEQTTSEVPLQPETGVSGEMEERTPETTTEQVTQEGGQAQEINSSRYLQEEALRLNEENVTGEEAQSRVNRLEADPIAYARENNTPGSPSEKFLNSLEQQPAAQEAAVVEEQAPAVQEEIVPVVVGTRASYNENNLPTELQGVEPVGRTQTGRGRNKKVTLQFSTEQMNEAGLGRFMQPEAQVEEAQIVEETSQPTTQQAPVVEEVQVEEIAPEVQQELDEFETILADEGFAFEEEIATEAEIEDVVVPPPPSRRGRGVSSKTPTQATETTNVTQDVTQDVTEELASQEDLMEEEDLIEELKNSDNNIAEAKQRAKDAIAKVRASKWPASRKKTEIEKIREKEREEVEDSRSWKKEFDSKLKAVQRRIKKARGAAPAAQPATAKKKKTAKQVKEEFIAEVDAEIKRERDISDRKLADLKNQESRVRRSGDRASAQKLIERIQDEQFAFARKKKALEAKKANPSAYARFRKRTEEEEAPLKEKEVSAIEKKMNQMPAEEREFEEPTVSGEVEINPAEDSKQPEGVISKVLKFLGLKSKDQMLRKIEDFDGIPMIMAMSDILSSGEIKDAMGNVMVVDGGLGFNTFGRNMELAWAGVTKDGAQKQYDEAVKVYEANKELFDRLWADGKIPKGHIPMAVMRMGNTAVNSNEAVFRYVLPYIQSLPLENRKAALNSLLETLNSKAEGNKSTIWYTELSEKLDNGELQSLEDVKAYLEEIISDEKTDVGKSDKAKTLLTKISRNKDGAPWTIDDVIEEVNERVDKIVPFMISNYIKENNIETLDGLFEAIIEQSKKRAQGEINLFSLPIRAYLYNSFFSKESKPEEIAKRKAEGKGKVKVNNLDVIKALLKGVEGGRNELFTSDYLYQQIGDPSMMKTKMGDVVGVMGIDVLNGGVAKSTHNNYGYGPKGRLISFISNPKQGVDVFPEFRSKAARVFKKDKKGNYPNADAVAGQTGGAFFMDSAFRGAKPKFGKITDMDMLIGKLRFAFPEVSVSNTEEEWISFTNQEGIRTVEKNGEIIYGVTKEGRIFLNPQFDSLRTPIHEFGHIWIDYLRSSASGPKGKKLLARGLELVDGTKEYKKALKEYGDRDIALEEALVELLAVKGDTIINAAQRAKFKSWMNAMFKYIKENLIRSKAVPVAAIKDLTLDEFINIGLADLFSGERVSSKFDARLAETAAKARKSKQTVVNNIVEIGRAKGISDAAIKEALKKRGYTAAQINEALAAEPDTTQAPVESLNEFLDSINTVVKEYAAAARKKVRADMKAKRAVLAAKLKAMQTKGSITAKQAQALLEKVNKLNLSNSVAVDRFMQFAENVFNNAEYVDSISTINRLLPAARRNIKSKLGIANDLVPLLQSMLGVKPTFVPMSVFDTYKSIIDTIGQRQTELTLPEISELIQQVQEVNEAIDVESGLAADLMDRLENYPDKVEDNGKLQYTETINKMLEDGIINDYEMSVMKKYRSMIAPTERAKKSEQELQDERNDMIDSLKNETVDSSTLPSRDERNLANKLAGFIKTDVLNFLTPQELKDLQKIVDNINNGFITNRAQILVEKMDGIVKRNNLISPIQRIKVMLGERLKSGAKKALFRKNGNFYKYILEGNSSAFIDEVFGNFRERPFYENIFKPLATALASFSAENRVVADRITKMEQSLAKAFGRNQNKITMSKFKMMTWLIQNEFESNPNSRQVNPAIEFLKKTIKETNADRTYYSQFDVKMFEEIVNKYQDVMKDENGDPILDKDGNEVMGIDMDKLFDSFNPTEKKILGEIRTINDMMSEKAEYTAAIIRGSRITPIANYISLGVINGDTRADQLDSINELRNVFGNSRTTSTRAKTLIERTGKVSAINFDPFSSVRRSASSVLMDYHLTPAVRQGRYTMRELEKAVDNKEIDEDKLPLVSALDAAFTQIVDTTVGNSFMSEGTARGIVNEISRQGYRAVLAGLPRMASEAVSNMSYILMKGAKSWAVGASYGKLLMSPDAFNVLKNVGSVQTNRIYSSSTVSSQLAASEIFNQTAGIRGSQAKGVVANAAKTVYNQTLKRVKNTTEATADLLMSTPDMVMIRPLWFGEFSRAFKKESGNDADFEKIANNDEQYMADNKDAIDAAKNQADDVTIKAGSSDNIALGILRNTVKPDDTEMKAWYKKFNSYMSKFLLFEYMTARSGINMLMKGNMIEKKEGIALIAAVTTRMMVYQLATRTLTNGFIDVVAGLLGYRDDDEEEEEDDKTVMQRVGQAVASTMTTLMFGRNLGNAARIPLNYGIEKMNEKYLESLRNGEYDMYEDALQFSIVPTEKPKGDTGKGVDIMDIYINTLGSAGPAVKTLRFLGKKLTEDDKKREDAVERQKKERSLRAPLELAGSLGYIPLYKDVRKVTMDYIYGDLDRAEKVTSKNIGELIKSERSKMRRGITSVVKMRSEKEISPSEAAKQLESERENYKKAIKELRAKLKKNEPGSGPTFVD